MPRRGQGLRIACAGIFVAVGLSGAAMAAPAKALTPASAVTDYCAAWSADRGARDRLLARVWATDGVYSDAEPSLAKGRAALGDVIAKFQRQYPGAHFQCSAPQMHHRAMRVAWILLQPDGTQVTNGVDIYDMARDGRIQRIVGFFGDPPSLPTSARAETGSATGAAADEPGLIGTWRLVRFEDTSGDGKVTHPFGEHPFGYFVYDPTGHLSVQMMRNPPTAPFQSSPAAEAELREANGAYGAYFGTYRVDKAQHVLHHIVEGSLNSRYAANPDQARPYRLQGDTLIIEMSNPKTGAHMYRELHRVK